MMRKYITQLSKGDFSTLHPNIALDANTSSFPQVVALISSTYPSLPTTNIKHVSLPSVKHIYSTRDYWEVVTTTSSTRHKIPKRYTDAIYLIEED